MWKQKRTEMSLVDYASDSDSDSDDRDGEGKETEKIPEASEIGPRPNSPPQNQKVEQPVRQRSHNATPEATPSSMRSIEKLPDASLLLNSPNLSSHLFSGNSSTSRVTATLAENPIRKRTANWSSSSFLQAKLPKGASSHSRNVSGNRLLVPPQLSGRSNVVTEDISKLFVKRHANQPAD